MGELLQESGELTSEQIQSILREQSDSHLPFGELAERTYGVTREATQKAWVKQYMSMGAWVDLRSERVDPNVLTAYTRRQAWQMLTLPVRREPNGLLLATCAERLPRAVTFAWHHLKQEPALVVVADRVQLIERLAIHYPWQAVEQMLSDPNHEYPSTT
jgi:hypothetical protein